jgi:biotin-independent malonate decarboxylase gamma subunit
MTANIKTPPIPTAHLWLEVLTGQAASYSSVPSVIFADAQLDGKPFRAITTIPNPRAIFPRARGGEFGIEESAAVADCVLSVSSLERKPPIGLLAIIDAPGQVYGRREEEMALHIALAAAVDAYGTARSQGHPVVALIVGKAISAAFLAQGLQAGRILALDGSEVEIHVMSRASVARLTRRSPKEIQELENQIPAIARSVQAFASLGGIDHLIPCRSLESPSEKDVQRVRDAVAEAFEELRRKPRSPVDRLDHPQAAASRTSSREVRRELERQWDLSCDAEDRQVAAPPNGKMSHSRTFNENT